MYHGLYEKLDGMDKSKIILSIVPYFFYKYMSLLVCEKYNDIPTYIFLHKDIKKQGKPCKIRKNLK